MQCSRILVRATNWVGDAVMSLPALQVVRAQYPEAHIAILARPWVADLYRRERFADQVILYTANPGRRHLWSKWILARSLARERFDSAILLQNAFDAALIAWMARVPRRIGYNRDGRGLLLTDPIPVPRPGEIPRHEKHYYLELLHRSGIIGELPDCDIIRLDGAPQARVRGEESFRERGVRNPVIGVSPGAAFGNAKRWLPERFAEAAATLARRTDSSVALFGSAAERQLCDRVAGLIDETGVPVRNLAAQTTLAEFIELAAACRLFLTNDSGAMHIASALGVPTVAVFGATDHLGTGPSGPHCRVVREPVDCSPCKLRECPIDHRCMTRIPATRVAEVALELLK